MIVALEAIHFVSSIQPGISNRIYYFKFSFAVYNFVNSYFETDVSTVTYLAKQSKYIQD